MKDALPNRPVIALLKDRSVGSLLKQEEGQEPVVDSTLLMSESLLEAMSRVSDNEQCGDRARERRILLRELLKDVSPEIKGNIFY